MELFLAFLLLVFAIVHGIPPPEILPQQMERLIEPGPPVTYFINPGDVSDSFPVDHILRPFAHSEISIHTEEPIQVTVTQPGLLPYTCSNITLQAFDPCVGHCMIHFPLSEARCLTFANMGLTVHVKCTQQVALSWDALFFSLAAGMVVVAAHRLVPMDVARSLFWGSLAMKSTSIILKYTTTDADSYQGFAPLLMGLAAVSTVMYQGLDPEDNGNLARYTLQICAIIVVWWLCGGGSLGAIAAAVLLLAAFWNHPIEAPVTNIGCVNRVNPEEWDEYQARTAQFTRTQLRELCDKVYEEPVLQRRLSKEARMELSRLKAEMQKANANMSCSSPPH